MTLPKNGSRQTSKVTPQKVVPTKTVNTAKGVGPTIAVSAQVPEPCVSIYPCCIPDSEVATLLRELENINFRFTSEIVQLEQSLLPVLPMNTSVSDLVLPESDRDAPRSPLATNLHHLMRSLECSATQLSALRSQLCV